MPFSRRFGTETEAAVFLCFLLRSLGKSLRFSSFFCRKRKRKRLLKKLRFFLLFLFRFAALRAAKHESAAFAARILCLEQVLLIPNRLTFSPPGATIQWRKMNQKPRCPRTSGRNTGFLPCPPPGPGLKGKQVGILYDPVTVFGERSAQERQAAAGKGGAALRKVTGEEKALPGRLRPALSHEPGNLPRLPAGVLLYSFTQGNTA